MSWLRRVLGTLGAVSDCGSEHHSTVWRRSSGWVFRVVPGRVLMARPGGEQLTIAGRASVAWTALDLPATTRQVWERIDEALPEVGVGLEEVDEAIAVLVDAGVVEQVPDADVVERVR